MLTLRQPHRLEAVIKRSRFVAKVSRAASVDEAHAFIEASREPKANHNCWAYKLGDTYRFSDDGEPSSTAGRPILAAIEGQGLDHVVAVVTRYFGGIKLGAGGLVRAYGGTAARCLQEAEPLEIRAQATLRVVLPFELVGTAYRVADQHGATRVDETYTATGVELTLRLDASAAAELERALRDATAGRATLVTAEP